MYKIMDSQDEKPLNNGICVTNKVHFCTTKKIRDLRKLKSKEKIILNTFKHSTYEKGCYYDAHEGVSKAKKHLQYKSKLATLVKYT